MASTTSATRSPASSQETTTAVVLTAQQIEIVARAENFVRLDSQVEVQLSTVAKRRTEEENQLLNKIVAIPDLSANNALLTQLRSAEAAFALLATDQRQIQDFQKLLQSRIDLLATEHSWALKSAWQAQLDALKVRKLREQNDVETVNKQIGEVTARIDLLTKLEEQLAAKAK
jgi:hypothetical protein